MLEKLSVLFSQNKPAPAISHQPNEQDVGELEVTFFATFCEFLLFLWLG
jgi:hypothetical protein